MAYNPLDPSQIGANTFSVLTGRQAWRNGATPMETVNIALWWRTWYKNMTGSVVLFFAAFMVTGANPGFFWVMPLQLLLNILVCGITYVQLIDVSRYKQRLVYRWFAPITHRTPYVARAWWYFLLLMPLWGAMWWHFMTSGYDGLYIWRDTAPTP